MTTEPLLGAVVRARGAVPITVKKLQNHVDKILEEVWYF